jgi:Fe-S-cluster containining protein
VITLSPYEVIRMSRIAGCSTGEAIRRYTLRRGSLLKFDDQGACVALDGARCSIHRGRPLACRLYPLGVQRDPDGRDSFVRLEPAAGSRGVYGTDSSVANFLAEQEIQDYLDAIQEYRRLLHLLRSRIAELMDFELTEPREFWRVARREALAETGYDPNPVIDALFDADRYIGRQPGEPGISAIVEQHLQVLVELVLRADDAWQLAAAAMLLSVSLGYPPVAAC